MDALLTVALVGVCTAMLVAMHLRLTTRPSPAVRLLPNDDIDGEFLRIVEREWLQQKGRNR